MALYPNNYCTATGWLHRYRFGGLPTLGFYNPGSGNGGGFNNRFVSSDSGLYARTASTPDGYGAKTPLMPVTAGGMSAANKPVADLQMTGNALNGGPMSGAGDITLDGSGGLSLVVSMDGTATVVTLSGDGMLLSLTIGLDGTGTMTLSGSGGLSMIVPFDGTGVVAAMTGGGTDLKGRLSMEGEWTPFTELSPEGLAAAVWNSPLAQYQGDGTAGKALSTASAGGVDLGALAAAVWTYVDRTLTDGGATWTPEEIAAAILLAAQATPIHSSTQNASDIATAVWNKTLP